MTCPTCTNPLAPATPEMCETCIALLSPRAHAEMLLDALSDEDYETVKQHCEKFCTAGPTATAEEDPEYIIRLLPILFDNTDPMDDVNFTGHPCHY